MSAPHKQQEISDSKAKCQSFCLCWQNQLELHVHRVWTSTGRMCYQVLFWAKHEPSPQEPVVAVTTTATTAAMGHHKKPTSLLRAAPVTDNTRMERYY